MRCLLVDDAGADAEGLCEALGREGFPTTRAALGEWMARAQIDEGADVVLLAIESLRRAGLSALEPFRRTHSHAPIVLLGEAPAPGDDFVFRALEAGAITVALRPGHAQPEGSARVRRLCDLLRRLVASKDTPRPNAPAPSTVRAPVSPVRCLGIVSGESGVPSLAKLVRGLPPDYPLPVLVVQHLPPGFARGLVTWLQSQCNLPVRFAESGSELNEGQVLIAPPDGHLLVSRNRLQRVQGPMVEGQRPSGTALLTSLARALGPHAAGIVLAGPSRDGALGLRLLREQGGITAAQSRLPVGGNAGLENPDAQSAAALLLELDGLAELTLRLGTAKPRIRAGAPEGRQALLLVDDAETILQLECATLGEHYELHLARNGQQAVELARELRPDGILMDYSMPVMNGLDALEVLKGDAATRTIPVLMVTSEEDASLLERCHRSGSHSVLRKPLKPALLRERVRELLATAGPSRGD